MSKKSKKQFIPFAEVRLSIETNSVGRVFAVNKEQFEQLSALEGQSTIQGDGIIFIEGVDAKLVKCPRIRKNYIVTTPENVTV